MSDGALSSHYVEKRIAFGMLFSSLRDPPPHPRPLTLPTHQPTPLPHSAQAGPDAIPHRLRQRPVRQVHHASRHRMFFPPSLSATSLPRFLSFRSVDAIRSTIVATIA